MNRLLILDDDEQFAQRLKKTIGGFKKYATTCVEATFTPQAAIDLALRAAENQQPFNVLLIDQNIDERMDGIQVMKELHTIHPNADAIIFTGLDTQEDGLQAYRAGASRYLHKPFKSEELEFVLVELERSRKARLEEARQRLQFEVAAKITEAVGANLDLDTTMDAILGTIKSLFDNTRLCVLLFDKHREVLYFAPATTKYYPIENPEYDIHHVFPLKGNTIACRAARHAIAIKKMEWINVGNVASEKDYINLNSNTRSECCVGLLSSRDELLGVLALERDRPNAFEDTDKSVIEMTAKHISISIERAAQSRELESQTAFIARTSWAANFAVELYDEIGNILNWTRLVREVAGSDLTVRKYAGYIERSAKELSNSIPWDDAPSEDIEIDRTLDMILNPIKARRNINIIFIPNAQNCSITINPANFRHIFRHLLKNSLHAMAGSKDEQIIIRTRLSNGHVEILFEDSGPGISEEERQYIFQTPVVTEKGGRGYGLLYVNQLVKGMNGVISLPDNHVGPGALFSIRFPVLPRKDPEGIRPYLATSSQIINPMAPRVLIVDNDPSASEFYEQLLRKWGFSPIAVRGKGAELRSLAISLAREHRCALALIDLRLIDHHDESDASGLKLAVELQDRLRPLVLGGYESQSVLRNNTQNHRNLDFLNKHDLDEIQKKLRAAAIASCAASRNLMIEHTEALQDFMQSGLVTSIPEYTDQITDIFARLFQHASSLKIDKLSSPSDPLGFSTAVRPNSIVLKVFEDEYLPIAVKIARQEKIRKEVDNYTNYINKRAGERVAPRLDKYATLWDIGGIAYTDINAKPFSRYYEERDVSAIEERIAAFFEAWRPYYEKAFDRQDISLFNLYTDVWGSDWYPRRQQGVFAEDGMSLNIGMGNVILPHPVKWIREKIIESSSDISTMQVTRVAITHGDLHSENLLVDDKNDVWVIDFERCGPGHALQDFIELEADILNRFHGQNLELSILLRVCFLVFKMDTIQVSDISKIASVDGRALKTLKTISTLRRLAQDLTGITDKREYLFGLLFNMVFRAALIAKTDLLKCRRPLLLASLICHRLDHWDDPWPPSDWNI